MTRKEFAKKYELPKKDRISIEGVLRPMELKDVKEVLRLYNIQNEKHGVSMIMSKADIAHQLMPKEGIV